MRIIVAATLIAAGTLSLSAQTIIEPCRPLAQELKMPSKYSVSNTGSLKPAMPHRFSSSAEMVARQKSLRQSTYVRPNAKERLNRYAKSFAYPFTYAGAAIGAGFTTSSNKPEEWGKSAKGFGRRFASNIATAAISRTITYGLDEAFRLDSGYYKSSSKKFSARLGNAIISSVTARTPSGKRTIGAPFLIGTYTANIIAAETWFPKRFSYKDGLRRGTISVGISAGVNILREFFFKK